jgi:glutamate synthase (NADPH) small chain
MGKPTGFLEYAREPAHVRLPAERVQDYGEIYLEMPDERLREQAARCMNCGIPFCHTGEVVNGLASGCPINNLIPEWNHMVYRGLWREAYYRLRKTNNFPEFTGRICPAPCEQSCTLAINSEPVTIKKLENTIIERAWQEGWVVPEPPSVRTGRRVAIIGSGPAGLSCAAQLNKAGHWVTVYERNDRIGGLLTYGIPAMKLDKRVVQRRVDLLAEEGISFVTNTAIGAGRSVADGPGYLLEEFDAVVLCTGASLARDLPIEGHDLAGIHYAVDFLRADTKSLLDYGHEEGTYISARGKHVVIVGGGDTGTDCMGTSIRHGCASVVQFEIKPQPPAMRPPDNPWPEWPKTERTDYGQEEAQAIFGQDPRQYSIATKRFLADESGHVRAVQTVRVAMLRENGRLVFRELPGSEEEWPAELVLLAMGFRGPEPELLRRWGVEQDQQSNIRTERGRFATKVPRVFAAGDARRGQSLVVWAINEGRAAARECDRYLAGGASGVR